jgi:hypothetical protein
MGQKGSKEKLSKHDLDFLKGLPSVSKSFDIRKPLLTLG